MQINILQTELVRILAVAEGYVIEINGTVRNFGNRVLRIGNIRNLNQHFVNTFYRSLGHDGHHKNHG